MRIQVLMFLALMTTTTFSSVDSVGAELQDIQLVGADIQSYVVTVDTGSKTPLQLKDRPRLSQLMAQLNPADDLYWPAARFYRDDPLLHYSLERKRRELLLQLGEIKRQEGKDAVPQDFTSLIRTARLAAPVALVLEPDAIAGKDEFNKQLDRGDYILRVAKRPKELEIVGFAGLSKAQHHYKMTVRGYTRDLTFSDVADQTQVYLLSPSLAVTVAGRAIWNESPEQVRPGTLLYIPLDESTLPADFQGINQQIIEFLQHRVTE
jgi:hypothetical protein